MTIKEIMENKSYRFEARIIDEDNDDLIVQISSHSEEDFMQEMGKEKWTHAIENYEIDLADQKAQAQAEALEDMEYDGKK